jgi:hypothetical protein
MHQIIRKVRNPRFHRDAFESDALSIMAKVAFPAFVRKMMPAKSRSFPNEAAIIRLVGAILLERK